MPAPVIENGKAVLSDLDGQLKLVPEDQAAAAVQQFGWSFATPADVAKDDAQKRSGGLVDRAATFAEEGVRKVASGGAAVARGVLGDTGADAGLVNEVTGSDAPFGGADLVPGAYSDAALERREVNPLSAAAGSAVPLIAGGLLAPATGGASLAATLGFDAVDGAAQEAMDAELEGRGISAQNVMRNGSLNAAFSLFGIAAPAAAKAVFREGTNAVKQAAGAAVKQAEKFGAKRVEERTAEALEKSSEALEKTKPPLVATNPNAQRMALQDLSDAFAKSHPEASTSIEGLVRGNGKTRFQGLQELRATNPGPEVEEAIDRTLTRSDLWGQKVIDHTNAMEAARGALPAANAAPEALTAYTSALRSVSSPRLAKLADHIDELAQTRALSPLAKDMAEAALKFSAAKGTRTAGAVVGHAIGGWPGAWMGQAVGGMLAPAAESAADLLKPAAERGFLKAAQALKEFAENDQRITAQMMVKPEYAERFSRVLGDTPTPLQRFQGDDENLQLAFDRHRQKLNEFSRNPESMVQSLEDEFGSVGQESPKLHRQMADQAFKVASFLQEKLPRVRGASVARPNGTPVSPLQLRTYALYATAAMDPGSALADAKAGRLKREQVEALQRLWPTEYAGLRNAVIETLGSGSTTVTRQKLNLLFGLGSSVDPALGPKVRAMVEAARAGKQKQAQAPAAPGISSQTLPSTATDAPAGQTAMQLGGVGGR